MSDEIQQIIKDYASNPLNNFVMEDYTVKYEEGNVVCDDSIEVFLKIDESGKIENYSYDGNLSIVGIAASSILAEEIIGKSIDEVMDWGYDYMKDLGFTVSARRKRAAVLPILAVRNAIHIYKKDGLKDEFDDLTESC